MLHNILVPLDGSERAEKAIPVAAHIAQKTGGIVHLLRTIPPVDAVVPYGFRTNVISKEVHVVMSEEANTYLQRIIHVKALAGVQVRTKTYMEVPAQAILHYAKEQQIDLIVLRSHGYTGFKRWALGSVAQQVTRHSRTPVLVLYENLPAPFTSPVDTTQPFHVLIGLDGSPLAEAALSPTIQLMTAISQPTAQNTLHLIRVIKPPSAMDERTYRMLNVDIDKYQREEAEKYLQSVVGKVTSEPGPASGIEVTLEVVVGDDTAATLIQMVGTRSQESARPSIGYDLLALATHGRGGMLRWAVGSTTERILGATICPLLIVRPAEAKTGED